MHCYRGVCVLIPATAFAQNLPSVSIITASREASGINPGYSLPGASFSESSLAGHAIPSRSPSIPTPSNQTPDDDREVSWRKLPMNLLRDQKDMWFFPLKLAKGRHWLPGLFITGGTAAFLATDPQVMPHFRKTNTFHGLNRVLGTSASGAAIAVVPAVFYAVSLTKNHKEFVHALLRSASGELCPIDKDLSWKSRDRTREFRFR